MKGVGGLAKLGGGLEFAKVLMGLQGFEGVMWGREKGLWFSLV